MSLNRLNLSNSKIDFLEFGKPEINYTSGGVLYKYIEEDDLGNPKYLYKTGNLVNKRFSNKEVVIEQICNDILDYLGIEHAVYSIITSTLSLNEKWIRQDILISKSEWFINKHDRFLHADKLIDSKYFRKPEAYYSILDLVPDIKDSLNNMILFDYLVNNTDRHFKNFGFIADNSINTVRLAPLYDHGFSLGIEYDSEYLSAVLDEEEDEYDLDIEVNLENCDTCKSFGSTNKSCLKLVEKSNLLLGTTLSDILSIVDKYHQYLSEENITFAKILLTDRYNTLKERYGN